MTEGNATTATAEDLLIRAKDLFTSDREQSVRIARECLEVARAADRPRVICQALNLIATDLFPRDRPAAVGMAREALELARNCARLDAAARSLNMIADAERLEGRLDSAHAMFSEACQCADGTKDALPDDIRADAALTGKILENARLVKAISMNALGAIAYHRGEHDLAINWFTKALRIYEERYENWHEDYDIAYACANIGLMHYEKGDIVSALDFSERSLAIRERIEDHAGTGEVSLNLGLMYADMGDWEKALERYHRAVAALELAKDAVSVALCYSNIGEAYLRRGKLERARPNLEKALALARAKSARWVEAEVLGNLGETWFAAGDVGRAQECYEQDGRICTELGGVRELALTRRRQAELDLYLNDVGSARTRLDEALALTAKHGPRKEEGCVKRVLGEAEALAGDAARAADWLQQSQGILRGLGKNYELGLTLLSLGRLQERTGADGSHTLRRALDIFRNLGIEHQAAEVEKLLAGRAAPAARADVVRDMAELVAAEPLVEALCRRALKLLSSYFPATGLGIFLRDGQAIREGAVTAETDVGGMSVPLETGVGRVGTLVVRGDVEASEVSVAARLLAMGICQSRLKLAAAPADAAAGTGRFPGIIGADTTLRDVFATVEKAAPTRANVLVLGESGTGKELVAQALHRLSDRAARPLVVVNCAAIPEQLLEAEMFGIEKGAATGVAARAGKLEAAHTGTIFLDEIGDMSLPIQAKMRRARGNSDIANERRRPSNPRRTAPARVPRCR